MIRYAEVFNCVLLHKFHSDSVGSSDAYFDFVVSPTPETAEILKRGNCLFKKTGNSFKLICEVEDTKEKVLGSWVSGESDSHLEFYINPTDQIFYNVTSSLEVQVGDSEWGNEGATVFRFKRGQPEAPVIRFWETPREIAGKPVFILIVPIAELVATTLAEDQTPQMPITFRSRSVYWRYNIARSKILGTTPTIVERNGEVIFNEVDHSEEQSQRFVQFISQQKIHLQARYDLRLELRERLSNGRETVLMDRLPLASPERLSNAPYPGTDLVSDIYVS